MSELRQNPITGDWVIISSKRRSRPDQFAEKREVKRSDEKIEKFCPFCEGNESMTPPEITAFRKPGTMKNTPGWWLRVIPNKFPALGIVGDLTRQEESDFFRKMDGVGAHEVIIEVPYHNTTIGIMEDRQVKEIVLAYRERFLDLTRDHRFQHIIIFRNRGAGAGASLLHPHSQLIATPVVPRDVRARVSLASLHYDANGRCIYCDTIREELEVGRRVIVDTADFIAVEPFASCVPFETWILPKKHNPSFGSISSEECSSLGIILNQVIGKLHKGLADPDYNYVISTSPLREDHTDFYHWFLRIMPRLTTPAGFEMGSGMYINTVFPEEAAEFLQSQ